MYSLLIKENTKNTIISFDAFVTSNKQSIVLANRRTKFVYFQVLQTCAKSHHPRGNNKKVMTNISSVSNSIGSPEKL